MGAEHCPLRWYPVLLPEKAGYAWMGYSSILFDYRVAEQGVVYLHTALRHPVLDASGERDRQKMCCPIKGIIQTTE